MLQIRELYANNKKDDKEILKGITLEVKPGEVHAIMGPNGSGKSTLASVLAGRDDFAVTRGQVIYNGQDLLSLSPEARAAAGLFLAFQYPVAIPGVNNLYFLKAALNNLRKQRNQNELDAVELINQVKVHLKTLDMDEKFLHRALNEGFSGGEKKRNEVLQMLTLQPCLAVLDETDSGLDIDALKIVARGVNSLRSPKRSFIVITHYQRLLDYITPDVVHVLADGKIVQTGDKTLARTLEKQGYSGLIEKKQAEAHDDKVV